MSVYEDAEGYPFASGEQAPFTAAEYERCYAAAKRVVAGWQASRPSGTAPVPASVIATLWATKVRQIYQARYVNAE